MNATIRYSLGLIAFLSGCDDFLVEEPQNFLTPNQFYNTEAQVTSAIIGVYDVLDDDTMYGQLGIISVGDGAADNLRGGASIVTVSLNPLTYEVEADNTGILHFYESSYQLINRANAVVDRLDESQVDKEFKQQIAAEAKFLRALSYFNLVRVFGDVPLRTHEATTLDALDQPRTPTGEVYAQIIQDLLEATAGLPDEPLDQGRANTWASKTLLAKVYLTVKQASDAAALTEEIISSGRFSLVPEYNRLFRPENANLTEEIIFAVQYSPQRRTLLTDFLTAPEVSAYGAFQPLHNVFVNDLYQAGDQRRGHTVFDSIVWQDEWLVPGNGLNFLKFAEEHYLDGVPEGQSGTMNYPVLRYADVLLMHAEALVQAEGTPSPKAYEALNQVRARAGLPPVSELRREDFLDTLLKERRIEFVLEGHRWFDLKRFDQLEAAMQIFIGWRPHFQRLPIPESAVIANPELTQNDGY